MNSFECNICGNKEQKYIGINAFKKEYCRLCITFQGEKACVNTKQFNKTIGLSLDYKLTEKQEEISKEILSCVKRNEPVLVNAITGAGKTELVYESMEYILKKGGQVGFASPRHDVVLELLPRIQEAFKTAKIVAVCEGHTYDLTGDIVILTAHQLYRYKKYFDLIIFDEIDAFPYKDSLLLQRFFKESIKGTYVLLTATPTKENKEDIKKAGGKVLTLNERYHGGKLVVPTFIKHKLFIYYYAIKKMSKLLDKGFPLFVFLPTISDCELFYFFASFFCKKGSYIHSKDKERDKKIEEFKKGKLRYLICTSILERGVTIKNLQVIVVNADYEFVYDSSTLIQISGRVGRKKGYEKGEVIFFGKKETNGIKECINEIKRINAE